MTSRIPLRALTLALTLIACGGDAQLALAGDEPLGDTEQGIERVRPTLVAPTALTLRAQTERSAVLTWRDDSSVETGFEVQYLPAPPYTSNGWLSSARLGPDVTAFVIAEPMWARDAVAFRVITVGPHHEMLPSTALWLVRR